MGEKSKAKANNAKFKSSLEIFKTLDCSAEDECNVINSLTKPDSRIKNLNTISDELKYVFGDNWISNYRPQTELPYKYISVLGRGDTGDPWWVAICLLIAKQGKLRRLLNWHSMWGDDKAIDVQKKTFDMIEKCIQEYHPKYHIFVVPDEYGCSKGFVKWNFEL